MSENSPCPIVIFDLDGVLIDSAEANVQAFRYGLSEVGLSEVKAEAILSLVGLPAVDMLIRLGCPELRAQEIFEQHVKPFYLENLPSLARAYPGARSVLSALLDSGFRVGACTSGDRQTQSAALEAVGLWDRIERMQTPDDSTFRKPDPRYLKELLAYFPQGGEVHHVEDSEVGLLMGKEVGAVTYFAKYGNGSLSDAVRPDEYLDLLTDLPQAILRAHARKS